MAKQKRIATIRSGVINTSQCPVCRAECDAWTGARIDCKVAAPTPEPGDPSICASCGSIVIFADYNGQLRLPERNELAAMPAEIRQVLQVVQTGIISRNIRLRGR